MSEIFIYLAIAYAISGVVLSLTRRMKLADFVAYLVSGFILGGVLLSWQNYSAEPGAPPFSREYRISSETLTLLQPYLPDSTSISMISHHRVTNIVGEKPFLDSLRFYLDVPLSDSLSWQVLKTARQTPANPATGLITLFASIGMLLFMMNLGANFELRMLRFNFDSSLLWQTTMMVLINAAIIGSFGFFLLFNGQITPTILLLVSLLSINAGSIIAFRFPIQPGWKRPVSRLLQITAIIDVLAITGYAWVVLLENYRENFLQKISGDVGYWLILMLIAAAFAFTGVTKRLMKPVGLWPAELVAFLRISLILLFIYCGFRINFPLIVLVLCCGLLLNLLLISNDLLSKKRFFSAVMILYPLPFIEVGRSAFMIFQQHISGVWVNAAVLLLGFGAIAAVVGVFWLSQKLYPVMMALGVFPRGEIATLILWQFWELNLISRSAFASGFVAIVLSSVIGIIAARFLMKPES